MESKAKVAGHPVHPMLIVFPLGLLSTAVIFDVIYLVSNDPQWTQVARYMMGAGVIGGLLAAIPGWIDWFAIPRGTRAKRVGLAHGVGNVVVLVLFALSWLLRRETPGQPPTEAVVAGLIGVVLAVITGWLGGELVDRLGVGVDDGAHLDSPSSLTALPAGAGLGVPRSAPAATPSAGSSAGWSGIERRTNSASAAAYAGVERRARVTR